MFDSKQDWDALMSSEIFRNYLNSEIQKEAIAKQEEAANLNYFLKIQENIKNDSKLKAAFLDLQNKLANDQGYRAKVNPDFAKAVMLLDLDGDEVIL